MVFGGPVWCVAVLNRADGSPVWTSGDGCIPGRDLAWSGTTRLRRRATRRGRASLER